MTTDKFESHSKKPQRETEQAITCKTGNLVYLIHCKKCGQQYVGETGNPLNERMNGHRYDIKDGKKTSVAAHFNQDGHLADHMQVMGIETGFVDSDARRNRKRYWISTLDTLQPKGMNKLS